MNTEKKQNPVRELLIKKSNEAKQIKENMIEGATTENEQFYWASKTINYMLLHHIYDTEGAKEFNTFNQWKAKGATVKKGSKAFPIWGQPIGKQKQQEATSKGEAADDESQYEFFPVCYLFSDRQVILPEDQEAEKVKRQAKKEARREVKEIKLQTVELD